MKIKNNSRAIQGIWNSDGELVHIGVGETSPDFTPADPKRVEALKFLEVIESEKRGPGRPPKDPLDHDGDGKKGGAAPAAD